MNWSKKVENIISNKKWVKNDTGLWKVQCCKLVKEEEDLGVFIVSDELDGPLYTRVEKISVINKNSELVVFYDGQYGSVLDESEYDTYSGLVTENEWKALFSGNATTELIKMNMVTDEEGFYIESHEGMERFINDFDEQASEEIAEHFHL